MQSIGISWRKNIIKLQIIQFYCSKTPLQSLKSKEYSLSSYSLPDLRRQKAILHRRGWFKTLWPLYSPSPTIPTVAHFGISGETRRLMLIPKNGRRARDKNGRESSSSEDSQNWTLGFLAKMTKQSEFDELNPKIRGEQLFVWLLKNLLLSFSSFHCHKTRISWNLIHKYESEEDIINIGAIQP